MAGVKVSECFLSYNDLIGGNPPEYLDNKHKCKLCKKIMNGYQAAVSEFCCVCTEKSQYHKDVIKDAKAYEKKKSLPVKIYSRKKKTNPKLQ